MIITQKTIAGTHRCCKSSKLKCSKQCIKNLKKTPTNRLNVVKIMIPIEEKRLPSSVVEHSWLGFFFCLQSLMFAAVNAIGSLWQGMDLGNSGTSTYQLHVLTFRGVLFFICVWIDSQEKTQLTASTVQSYRPSEDLDSVFFFQYHCWQFLRNLKVSLLEVF